MKKFSLITALSLCLTVMGSEYCEVSPDFVKNGGGYLDLDNNVEILFEGWGAPVFDKFITAYNELSWNDENIPCMALKNTYLRDTLTGKQYLMITTHEDYCDGGNTWGYIIDTQAAKRFEGSIVGEVSDGEVYCPNKEKYLRHAEYLSNYAWLN